MNMQRWWNNADRGMRKDLEETHVPLLTPYWPTQSKTRASTAIGCQLNITAYRTSSFIITCSTCTFHFKSRPRDVHDVTQVQWYRRKSRRWWGRSV